jgi:hypothetical protein
MKLPENKTYVLAYFPNMPWGDSDSKNDEHKWVVVKFIRGISQQERDSLSEHDVRKHHVFAQDEDGNNLVPYIWKAFTGFSFFGQECTKWVELPK